MEVTCQRFCKQRNISPQVSTCEWLIPQIPCHKCWLHSTRYPFNRHRLAVIDSWLQQGFTEFDVIGPAEIFAFNFSRGAQVPDDYSLLYLMARMWWWNQQISFSLHGDFSLQGAQKSCDFCECCIQGHVKLACDTGLLCHVVGLSLSMVLVWGCTVNKHFKHFFMAVRNLQIYPDLDSDFQIKRKM